MRIGHKAAIAKIAAVVCLMTGTVYAMPAIRPPQVPPSATPDKKIIEEIDYDRTYVCHPWHRNGQGSDFSGEKIARSLHLPSLDVTNQEAVRRSAKQVFLRVFGKNALAGIEPLQAYLYQDTWFVAGTVPPHMKGGGPVLFAKAETGQITCIFAEE